MTRAAPARRSEAWLVHLYALEGAVRGVDFNELPPEVKADLKEFSGALKGKGGSPR